MSCLVSSSFLAELDAHAQRAVAQLGSLPTAGFHEQDWTSCRAGLQSATARIHREATQVGVLGHLPGDLARAVHIAFGQPLLHAAADSTPGPLLRIVPTSGEAELEEHTHGGSPWHWSTAHPDPVPPLQAQATHLHAEQAAVATEDQRVQAEAVQSEQAIRDAQQAVFRCIGALRSAERTGCEARQRAASARTELDVARSRHPDAAKGPSPSSGLSRRMLAAVGSPFPPDTTDARPPHDAAVAAANAQVHDTTAQLAAAESAIEQARAHLRAAETALVTARRAHRGAATRHRDLRTRAETLSRERLALARRMDHAARTRLATMADDLATRLHGDPTRRLRLRWPSPPFGDQVIALVAPGTHAADPLTRRTAEQALASRADALLICASLVHPPEAERARVIRRMARQCPLVAFLFFHEGPPSSAEPAAHVATKDAWAEALGIPRDRLLASSIASEVAPPTGTSIAGERTRRECRVLGLSIQHAPPVARSVHLAQAIRAAAQMVDREHQRRAGAPLAPSPRSAAPPLRTELTALRDDLLTRATQLEALVAHSAHRAGVVPNPDHPTTLSPPPPPPVPGHPASNTSGNT